MSLILKSNNTSLVSFGNIKTLGKTPEVIFSEYKARVLADGGVVKDEAHTLRAVELLFNSNLYGKIATYVSGKFGVKSDSSGISKLYSLDGNDLVGSTLGTGVLPKLTAGNKIDFSANLSATNNGGFFTTPDRVVVTQTGEVGLAVGLTTLGTLTSKPVAGLSARELSVGTAKILQLTAQSSSLAFEFSGTAPFSYSNPNISSVTGTASNPPEPISMIVAVDEQMQIYYRGGSRVTTRGGYGDISGLAGQSFYIDFGAEYRGSTKKFFDGVADYFMIFKNSAVNQGAALSLLPNEL